LKAGPYVAREFLEAKYGKGGFVDALKNLFKASPTEIDMSKRGALGLREKVADPGILATGEKELLDSDIDLVQGALTRVSDAVLNQPVTRRDVLKRGALSTVSDLIPGGALVPQLVKAATDIPAKPLAKVATKVGLSALSKDEIADVVDRFIESGAKRSERGIEKFLDNEGYDLIDEILLAANKLDDLPDDAAFSNIANESYGEVYEAIMEGAKRKKKTDPAISEMYPNQIGTFKGITQKEIDEIVNEFVDGNYSLTNDGIEQFMDNDGFELVDNALAAKNNLRAADMEKDEILQLMNADYQTVMDALRNKRKASKKKAD
jgi:hypothetical protein